MKTKIYVGVRLTDGAGQTRTVFRSEQEPTRETCSYVYVIGPFRTMAGAQFMADYGGNNPHLQHVDDAERLARHHATHKPDALLASHALMAGMRSAQ